jgi:hypothetical protein
MDKLAAEFAEREARCVFLYTGEAHPGENLPPLDSMECKLANARALTGQRGIARPVYADALSGDCHLAYGGLPNMCWIFSSIGVVLYKADWTGVESVRNALDYLLDVRAQRKAGEKTVGFRVERFDYRRRDREEFFRVLEHCGPQAVQDFHDTFGPDWAS